MLTKGATEKENCMHIPGCNIERGCRGPSLYGQVLRNPQTASALNHVSTQVRTQTETTLPSEPYRFRPDLTIYKTNR